MDNMTAEHHAKIAALKVSRDDCCVGAAREMTVGELLDRRLEAAERLVQALRDLKGSLPGNYLNSGASRIASLVSL
jgi:hypothetical protein